MAISHNTAAALSHDLVRLIKLFQSIRQHAPRLHPGVEAASYPIMFTLSEGPSRVSTLAECVHSDVSTVSRQVSSLVAHGLLERLPDPADGRASRLSLTVEGQALLDQLRHQRGEWFRSVLQDWSEEEALHFIATLERLAGGLEASRDRLMQMMAAAATTATTRGHTATTTSAAEPDLTGKEQ